MRIDLSMNLRGTCYLSRENGMISQFQELYYNTCLCPLQVFCTFYILPSSLLLLYFVRCLIMPLFLLSRHLQSTSTCIFRYRIVSITPSGHGGVGTLSSQPGVGHSGPIHRTIPVFGPHGKDRPPNSHDRTIPTQPVPVSVQSHSRRQY